MVTKTLLATAGLIVSARVYAQPVEDTSNVSCIERLQLPSYPPLARMARIVGVVVVVVDLGEDAKVRQVVVDPRTPGGHPILFAPVEYALRRAQFNPGCIDTRVTLVFEFKLEGDPYDRNQQDLAFGFPNRFYITARLPVPIPATP